MAVQLVGRVLFDPLLDCEMAGQREPALRELRGLPNASTALKVNCRGRL